MVIAGLFAAGCGKTDLPGSDSTRLGASDGPSEPPPVTEPVFSKDVAGLVYSNCTPCHRPSGAAPFSLISYHDVAKRADQIAETVRARYMPPWLPVHGVNAFEGERWLTDAQISIFERWAASGALEGDLRDLPPLPEFPEGWRLGKPDLVVTPRDGFPLPPDGNDIYRNLVVPIPVDSPKFVRGMEFQPGKTKSIHHAFLLVDTTSNSRVLDAADEGPGFGGMDTGTSATSPGGHFISWQPGKTPSMVPDGMSWRLAPGTDLVLQLHMQTTGKGEIVNPAIAFYFTADPPTRFPYKLVLRSTAIDIPAGMPDYAFEQSYTLPVAVNALAVIPHAHYLGKSLHAFARLPNGETRWLLRIDNWDFNWQGDYRYRQPLHLPKGSVITQRFIYDNSAANPRIAHNPPRRTRYGLQTTDEMGEFWLQVEPANPGDAATLNRDFGAYAIRRRIGELRAELQREPGDAAAWKELGKAALAVGSPDEARSHLQRAIALDGEIADAHYLLGMLDARANRIPQALESFRRCVQIDPRHAAAQNGLGIIALQSNQLDLARKHFENAIRADAQNPVPLTNLARVCLQSGQKNEALSLLERARTIDPRNPEVAELLKAAAGN